MEDEKTDHLFSILLGIWFMIKITAPYRVERQRYGRCLDIIKNQNTLHNKYYIHFFFSLIYCFVFIFLYAWCWQDWRVLWHSAGAVLRNLYFVINEDISIYFIPLKISIQSPQTSHHSLALRLSSSSQRASYLKDSERWSNVAADKMVIAH